jgi:hypothetical protein
VQTYVSLSDSRCDVCANESSPTQTERAWGFHEISVRERSSDSNALTHCEINTRETHCCVCARRVSAQATARENYAPAHTRVRRRALVKRRRWICRRGGRRDAVTTATTVLPLTAERSRRRRRRSRALDNQRVVSCAACWDAVGLERRTRTHMREIVELEAARLLYKINNSCK